MTGELFALGFGANLPPLPNTAPNVPRVLPGNVTPYGYASREERLNFKKEVGGKMEEVKSTAMEETNIQRLLPHGPRIVDRLVADFSPFNSMDVYRSAIYLSYSLHSSATCPACDAWISAPNTRDRFWQCKRVKCPSCGKFFTSLTGTPLSKLHLAPEQIILGGLLISLGVPSTSIATILCTTPACVRSLKRRLETPLSSLAGEERKAE